MPSADVDYPEIAQLTHRLLRERGITCDVIHPSADLSAYAVVIVLTLYPSPTTTPPVSGRR